MPKLRIQVLLILTTLVLAGCGTPLVERTSSHKDPRPVVLTTFSVLADLTRSVAGEHIRVESITKIGTEIHGYDPTPSDLVKAQDAERPFLRSHEERGNEEAN